MYQYGSTDAFGDHPSSSIDDAYGDVVSVTVGAPRPHVFSYVFGYLSGGSDDGNCPAIGGAWPPAFVGSDYLCAIGNPSASGHALVCTRRRYSASTGSRSTSPPLPRSPSRAG
jgi:hypothetical protein